MKDDDTAELDPKVQTPGPPLDCSCPTTAGDYIKNCTRHADGSCTEGPWIPK
jgi:hypothetical protein